MLTMSATEVRKDWSRVLDSVTRRRPAFIKRTHDNVVLASTESLSAMLSYVRYETTIFQEDDGSRAHLPYVMKALIADSPKELEDAIECHAGKN